MNENISIYNSDNEVGLLKSVGPYKATTADKSIMGVRLPNVTKVSAPVTIGFTRIYGSKITGKQVPKPLSIPSSK